MNILWFHTGNSLSWFRLRSFACIAGIDLSLIDEANRESVVTLHQKLLKFLTILEPEIILFHPSYYLGLNERDVRKRQLLKSVRTLNASVQAINAIMVVENMLGPELMRDENRERPLLRTVAEAVEVMNQMPASVYSAIDMNHIANPEKLIRAMGRRLRSVHIADGNGREENHYSPCSGLGSNNWIEILKALDEVGYNGPFLFECHHEDEKDLVGCHKRLHSQFVATLVLHISVCEEDVFKRRSYHGRPTGTRTQVKQRYLE